MASVQLREVSKVFDNFVALQPCTLDIHDGEFLVLLGPSGCGKTTTLRVIAGFIDATQGRITIAERDVTNVPVYQRNVGVVFQNYALFPHLDVFENVAFGLRRRKRTRQQIDEKVSEVLRLVQLEHLAKRYARQLSGGQQQRVAIARALAIEPDVLLLDEPLSNLDAKLRLDVRRQIRQLQRTLGITTILVTHDQEEAMAIGDRLVVMNQGAIQQVGSPRDVYRSPANAFVADFIGSSNFFEGTVHDDGAILRTESGLSLACCGLPPGRHHVLVRPEAITLAALPTGASTSGLHGEVTELTYLGPTVDIRIRVSTGDVMIVRADSVWVDEAGIVPDAAVQITIPSSAIRVIG
jgi:spermidine/putrescine ABC transporter ATP-binding subunit